MKYEVELTDSAFADLERLTDSLAERWPEGAERLTSRFFAALTRLEQLPLACGIAYENRFFPSEVRHLLFEVRKGRTYRAIFTVRGNHLRVLAIRAPGERPVTPDDIAN